MRLIVQKYGGTSVGNPERIRNVAQRLIETQREGCRVVAVISAMAGVTDKLIKLARATSSQPTARELDILLATGENAAIALTAMAVNSLGGNAVSLTGAEAGILTDRMHTKAKIANISPRQIQALLAEDYIVIVAGFQGQTAEGETTTLGRGGSDLTAIALAGALNADACQIFTDVDGVFTCDPRVVGDAQKVDEIAYDELLEMAGAGSKVMQSRAVEFAKKFEVPFEVRSSFSRQTRHDRQGRHAKHGRRRHPRSEHRAKPGQDHASTTCATSPASPGEFFPPIAAGNIIVDMIVQSVSEQGTTDVSFTIHENDLDAAKELLAPIVEEVKAAQIDRDQRRGET